MATEVQDLSSRGIDFFSGSAVFTSPHELTAGDHSLLAEKIIIATGARPVIPSIDGLHETGYWTSFNAVYPDRQPESLAIIGGSAVGCEFAQIYSRIGTRVTVIEMQHQLLGGEDAEVAELLADALRAEGIEVYLDVRAKEIKKGTEGKLVVCESKADDSTGFTVSADEVLVAVGRAPALDGLGLNAAGVSTLNGAIEVDGSMRTTQPYIWACGDAIGSPMLSHLASYEGNVAGNNSTSGTENDLVTVDYRVVPSAVFTDPPVASAGISEDDGLEAGMDDIIVGRAYYADLGRAAAMGETQGMVKLIVCAGSRELLGAHIFGTGADMIIHEAALAMRSEHGVDALLRPSAVHIHPTISEIMGLAAASVR
jgi:pyruvate/2-oxoglutarate dehydrogenase complex dihydrolipoamide dehydrogenase (E3) component